VAWPTVRAQRPRPASACASSQEAPMAWARSRACRWHCEVAEGPVQRPPFVERLGLASPVAEVAVDVQALLQGLDRGRVIAGRPLDVPQFAEGVGLAEPVTGLPRGPDRGLVAGDGLGPGTVAPQQPSQGGGQGGGRPCWPVA
jgi:hypothetical protein